VADQAASSITNAVAAVAAARALSPSEFGAVAIAMLLVALCTSAGRAIGGDLLLAIPRESWCRAQVVGASTMVGASLAVMLLVAAPLVGGDLVGPLLVASVAIPGLLVFDSLRYQAIASSRERAALGLDVAWLVGQLPLLAAVTSWAPSGEAMIAGWLVVPAAVGVGAAAVVGRPLARAPAWFRARRSAAVPLLGELLIGAGGRNIVILIVSTVGGLVAAAGLRGALVLVGPVTLVNLALPALLSTGAREGRVARADVVRATSSVVAAAVIVGVGVRTIDLGTLERLLGESASAARELILPVVAYAAVSALAVIPLVALRLGGHFATAFRLRLGSTISAVAVALIVGSRSPAGAVWGLVLVEVGLLIAGVLSRVRREGASRLPAAHRVGEA
jgi:hypothetical protein